MTAVRPLHDALPAARSTHAPTSPMDHRPASTAVVGTVEQVRLLKALADPVRLRLLGLITAAPPGGICVCDIVAEFNLTQPTISHHLKLLRDAELVDSHRKGTWAYYAPRPGALAPLHGLLDTLDAAHLSQAALPTTT